MSRRRLRGLVTLATGIVAASARLLTVSVASADCGMQAPPTNIGAYRGTAFIGRVTANEPTRLLYRPSGSRSGQIRLTFEVERPIAGVTGAEVVVIGGERGNCANFWASVLAVGDRVLTASGRPGTRTGSSSTPTPTSPGTRSCGA